MRISTLVGAAVLTLTLGACGSTTDEAPAPASSSAMDGGAMKPSEGAMKHEDGMSRTGTFAGLNGKKVAGTVTVADGKVTLSGFSSDEGPDLHLYLTNGDDEAAVTAGTALGEVSYDTASQTFELGDIDASTFDTVVVHCDKAKAVFGAAGLSS